MHTLSILGVCALLAVVCASHGALDTSDVAALLEFYTATNGANWTVQTGSNDTFSDPCSSNWFGVTCSTDLLPRVLSIQLPYNGLSGTLPSSLSDLDRLVIMTLSGNTIGGTIPDLTALTKLSSLRLDSNDFSGTLSETLFSLPSLSILDISYNKFTGALPTTNSLYYIPLTHLSLRSSGLSGPLPAIYSITADSDGECTVQGELVYLDAAGTDLNGATVDEVINQMVASIANHPALCGAEIAMQHLDLSSTNMTGDPDLVFYFGSLGFLSLADNQLTGPLPPSTALPPFIASLLLSGNDLAGTIPSDYKNALGVGLEVLDLRQNPNMGGLAEIPDWLEIQWSSITVGSGGEYVCAGITDSKSASSQILVDPQFFGFVVCNCSRGYFGSPAESCILSSTLCPHGAASACVADSSGGEFLTAAAGYWPEPNPLLATSLAACPLLAGGQTSCNPAGSAQCTAQYSGDETFTVCGPADLCAEGFTGPHCAECGDGYTPIWQQCYACPEMYIVEISISMLGLLLIVAVGLPCVPAPTARNLRLPILMITFGGAFAAFITAAAVPSAAVSAPAFLVAWGMFLIGMTSYICLPLPVTRSLDLSAVPKARIGIAKSVLVHLQTMALVLPRSPVWPISVIPFFARLSAGVTAFPWFTCLSAEIGTYLGTTLAFLLLPLALGVFVLCIGGLYAVIGIQVCGGKNPLPLQEGLSYRLSRTITTIFYTTTPIIFSAGLSVFACVPDTTGTAAQVGATHVVVTAPWQSCGTSSWVSIAIASAVLLVFYVLYGIRIGQRTLASHRGPSDKLRKSPMSFLSSPYTPRVWFFELVVTIRRIAVATVAAVSPPGQPLAILAVMIILLVALMVQSIVRPFRSRLVNNLESASLALLALSVGAGPLIWGTAGPFQPDDLTGGVRGLRWVVVVAHFVILGLYVVGLAIPRLLVGGLPCWWTTLDGEDDGEEVLDGEERESLIGGEAGYSAGGRSKDNASAEAARKASIEAEVAAAIKGDVSVLRRRIAALVEEKARLTEAETTLTRYCQGLTESLVDMERKNAVLTTRMSEIERGGGVSSPAAKSRLSSPTSSRERPTSDGPMRTRSINDDLAKA